MGNDRDRYVPPRGNGSTVEGDERDEQEMYVCTTVVHSMPSMELVVSSRNVHLGLKIV